MRIGFDISAALVRQPTGVAAAIVEQIHGLAELGECEIVACLRLSRFRKRRLARLPATVRQRLFVDAWLPPFYDLFHGPDTRLPRSSVPCLATIHDFSALQDGGRFSRAKFRETRERHYARARERAAGLVVYTEAIGRECQERLSIPPERIHCVPLAPAPHAPPSEEDHAWARSLLGGRPGILVLGEISRRKNTLGALEAFLLARERSSAVARARLLVVGREGFGSEDFLAAAGARHESVLRPGYLSAGRISALLEASSALLFPTRYEGFGLPVLEAMRRGLPVLASSCPAVVEVAGEAAWLAPAEDVEGHAANIVRVLEDEGGRADLVAKGRERSRAFSWEQTARGLMEAYRAVIAGS